MRLLFSGILLFYSCIANAEPNSVDLKDPEEELQKYVETLPISISCVPDMSVGLKREQSKEDWNSKNFITSEKNHFTASFVRSDGKNESCLKDAKKIEENDYLRERQLKEGKIICGTYTYMAEKDNQFETACKIANGPKLGNNLYLICKEGNLLIDPNNNYYLERSDLGVGILIGEASLTKGHCTKVDLKTNTK